MSEPEQGVLWVSDEDEIAANAKGHQLAENVIENISNHYLRHQLAEFSFFTLASDDDSMFLTDLTALADLSAGALCDVVGELAAGGSLRPDRLWRPVEMPSKAKAACVFDWLCQEEGGLTRAVFAIEAGSAPGRLEVRRIGLASGP